MLKKVRGEKKEREVCYRQLFREQKAHTRQKVFVLL